MFKAMNKTAALLLIAVSFIFSAGLFFGGFQLQKKADQENQNYTGTTEAVIADYEVRQEEITTETGGIETTDTVDFNYPVLEYTVDGKDYRVVDTTGYGDPPYEVNSSVTIHYLPSDPSQFYIAGDSVRTWIPYVMYIFGAASAVVVLVSLKRVLF